MAMESPEEKKIEKKAAIPSETLLSWRDLMHHVAAVFKFMWKLIKSILTSIPTTAMVFFVFSAFTGWGFYMFHGSVNRQFDSLFDERYTSTNPVCYGREDFKQNLKMLIDSPNPKGVIFVSGSKNSGKTTAIKSALQGRRHVTYINLRYLLDYYEHFYSLTYSLTYRTYLLAHLKEKKILLKRRT